MFGKFGSLLSFRGHSIGRHGATCKRRQNHVHSWQVSSTSEQLESRALLAATPGPDINVSQLNGDQYGPQIAVNPTNPNQIVILASNDNFPTSSLQLYVSEDNGGSWTLKPLGFTQDQVTGLNATRETGMVAFDGYGNLHVAYSVQNAINSTGSFGNVAVYGFSPDGGDTFSIQRFDESTFTQQPRPAVVVGPSSASSSVDDQVWFIYEQPQIILIGQPTIPSSFVVRTGQVLGPGSPPILTAPSNIFGDPFDETNPEGAVSPSGTFSLVRQFGFSFEGPSALVFTRDLDGPRNGPFIEFDQFFTDSIVTGTNSGYAERYEATFWSGAGGGAFGASAQIAYDLSDGPHRGRLYMVYADEIVDESDDSNIYLLYSDDDGSTWSNRIRINDDTGTNSQFIPSLSVDPVLGLVVVGWYDARNDTLGGSIDTNNDENDEFQYFIASSSDGGETFSPNVAVSDGTNGGFITGTFFNFGAYTGVAAYDGDAYVTWADGSDSTGDNPGGPGELDIYFDKVAIDPNLPPTITQIPDIAIQEDTTTGPLSFTIGDTRTAPSQLVVTVTSSDPNLIPNSGMVLTSSDPTGADREVTVTPAANRSGVATVTVSVFDGRFTTNMSFVVDVQPVPDVYPQLPEDTPTTTTFSDGTLIPITDDNLPTNATPISVSGLDTYLVDVNVTINLTHTRNSDLNVVLISPSGTRVTLTSNNGGDNDNVFAGTLFDDQAVSTPVTDYVFTDAVTATYLVPEGALAQLIGEDPNGDWNLEVTDSVATEIGDINGWSLELTTLPGTPKLQTFTALQSNSAAIPDATVGVPTNVNGVLESTINFNGLDFFTWDVDLHLNLQHTNSGDLDIYLISPAGTTMLISSGNGGAFDDIYQFPTTFSDQASAQGPVSDLVYANDTAVGLVIPEGAMAGFLGDNPNGDWTLRIIDHSPTGTGTLLNWSLDITTVFINDAPTIGSITNPGAIPEDSGLQTVSFNSVSAGGGENQPLRVTAVSNNPTLIPNPAANYLSPNSAGTLSYTPVPNQFGVATIFVTVEDGGFDQDLSTPDDNATTTTQFTVVVNPVNDAPTIDPISNPPAILEDAPAQQLTITGLSSGGGENQPLKIVATSGNLQIMFNPTVEYSQGATTAILHYQSNPNFNSTVTVTVDVTDGGLDNNLLTTADNVTTTRTFEVTITPVNDLPTLDAINNPTPITEDSPQQTIGLTGITAGGSETQELRVTAVSGNPAVVPDVSVNYTSPNTVGSLTYRAAPNAFGTAVVTVTVEDGGSDGFLATTGDNTTFQRQFTITVTQVNDAPVFKDFGVLAPLNEDAPPQTLNLQDVSAGPFENQALAFSVTSSNTALIPTPIINYTSPSTTGTLQYTVTPNSSGASVLTITLMDGGVDNDLSTLEDNATFVRQVVITVLAANDPPTLDDIPDPANLDEDSPTQTISLTGISAGGAENQLVQVTAVSSLPSIIPNPVVDYVSGDTTGTLHFTPNPDQVGSVTISVIVTDAGPDGDFGTAGDNGVTTKVFTVTLDPINDPPHFDFIADPAPVVENSGQTVVDISGIIAGPSETQQLQIVAFSSDPSIVPDPSIVYVPGETSAQLLFEPVPGQSGSVIITVVVTDPGLDDDFGTAGDNLSYEQDFVVTVFPTNDPPTINNIANPGNIQEDAGQQTINLSGLSSGDAGQAFQVTASSNNPALISTVTVNHTGSNATGTLNYTPVANQSGTAIITVTVTDGGNDNNLATTADNTSVSTLFTVTVTAVNDNPTLASLGGTYDLAEDAPQQTIPLTGISAGGGESQPIAVTVQSQNTALINNAAITYTSPSSTGSLTFTPLANQSGSAVLRIRVEDGGLDGDLSTTDDNAFIIQDLTVNVAVENDPPTIDILPTPLSVLEDVGPTTINLGGIGPGSGESQSVTVTAESDNPALIPNPVVNYTSGNSTGTLTFTPVANQSGVANLLISVEDSAGGLTQRVVTIVVTPVNDLPTINSLGAAITIDEDAPEQTINLSGISAGAGENGQVFDVTVFSDDTGVIPNPTLTYTPGSSTGSFTFQPLADQNGEVVLTVRITDGGADNNLSTTADNGTTQATLTVNVTAQPETPSLTIDENNAISAGGRPTNIAPSADLTDTDSETFNTGSVNVEIIEGAQSGDQLRLLAFGKGSDRVRATKSGLLKKGKTVIGNVTGGRNGVPLAITFTTDIDGPAVQQIIRHIQFRGKGSETGLRTIQITVTDDTGLTSDPVARVVVLN